MDVFKEFTFEAAHLLPRVSEGHKCGRLHGHSFRVIVYVRGPLGKDTGWVMDFADVKAGVQPVIDQLDHRYLNEIEGLENPTAEVLAVWIWDRVVLNLPTVSTVEVRETCTAGAVWHGWDRAGSGWKSDDRRRIST